MSYYLYGLQRSGTNVIQKFLESNYQITFKNKDNNRQSCQHKHFRIYDNKDIIPITDQPNQFKNKYQIDKLQDLDQLLGDTRQTNKYVIVYKNIYSWLPSIEKWALQCNWKQKQKMEFIDDYLNFIHKWDNLKTSRVMFISYEDYLHFVVSNDNKTNFQSKIDLFFYGQNKRPKRPKRQGKIIKMFSTVNCSDPFTITKCKYYTKRKYMDKYSPLEIKQIEANPLYPRLLTSELRCF